MRFCFIPGKLFYIKLYQKNALPKTFKVFSYNVDINRAVKIKMIIILQISMHSMTSFK